MKTIVRLIFCLLLVVGWGLAGLSLHVIRTADQIPITLVPKDQLGVVDTYVDTRNWTADDIALHPELVERLIHAGKADVLKHCVADANGDVSAQLSDVLARAPKPANQNKVPTTAQQATRAISAMLTINRQDAKASRR
jgi:hypothetical protein